MRVAVVAHGYPEREDGGVERVAREQADALLERGHEVAVFARTRAPTRPDASVIDEWVGRVRVRRVVYDYPWRDRFREYYDHTRLHAAFAAFLDEWRPELVHVQHVVLLSPAMLEVARGRGIPYVLSLHDFYYLCHRLFLVDREGERCEGPDEGARCEACLADLGAGEDARHRFDFMAGVVARAEAVIAPSRSLAERYEREWPFLAGRIRIVEPGLSRLPRCPSARRHASGTSSDPLRLLFIGTWLPHKGLDLLLAALGRLPPGRARLVVHGAAVEGGEAFLERCREASRGLAVEWRGRFDGADLDRILAEADALVLPSRCDESYSRVVREARAAGLAVVAPSSGGPAEALRDGVDALLVPPGDVAALAEALARLIGEPGLLARLGAAPARVATVEAAAAKLERIFAEVLASRPRSERPRVSVCYPTKDGARYLGESLAAVRGQRGDFELVEILAVDSGSEDGTLEILRRAGARVIQIPAGEFGHGRTRNLLAREAGGEFVVFLTQDATPADERWLDRLLGALVRDPLLAGVWSLHRPRPGCHPMERRQLAELEPFRTRPWLASTRGGTGWPASRERLALFSNSASAIRRSVLERWPFPDVPFAEDQAWARAVLEAGWRLRLVHESVVLHSHSYSPGEAFRRYREDARGAREALGRQDPIRLRDCFVWAWREARRDVAFAASQAGAARLRASLRWALPALAYELAAFTGRWAGARSPRRGRSLRDRGEAAHAR